MEITFDPKVKIAGIGIVPWTRLGLERWLDDFVIMSFAGWDVGDVPGAPRNYALRDHGALELTKYTSTQLVSHPVFAELVEKHLPGYEFLTYKPVPPVGGLRGRKVLCVDPTFTARFENKAELRRLFDGKLPFAPYRILPLSQLYPTEGSYDSVMGGHAVKVMQGAASSGGKGTFILHSFDDYVAALDNLAKETEVVVSDFVPEGEELSVQAVVTRHGIFTGPLQRQIVREPHLCNLAEPQADKFCGAEISYQPGDEAVWEAANEWAQTIGRTLRADGYSGIFGIDLLRSGDRLIFLEINPRITGVTPLLTMLYEPGDIPFYLLHALELGDHEYELHHYAKGFQKPRRSGSLLLLHAHGQAAVHIAKTPRSGRYSTKGGGLEFIEPAIQLGVEPGEVLIQDYHPPTFPVKPGGRLVSVFYNGTVLAGQNVLTDDAVNVINNVYRSINVTPVAGEAGPA